VLIDPKKRTKYDCSRNSRGSIPLFASIFGRIPKLKASPIEFRLACTLEEMYSGTAKRIRLTRDVLVSGYVVPFKLYHFVFIFDNLYLIIMLVVIRMILPFWAFLIFCLLTCIVRSGTQVYWVFPVTNLYFEPAPTDAIYCKKILTVLFPDIRLLDFMLSFYRLFACRYHLTTQLLSIRLHGFCNPIRVLSFVMPNTAIHVSGPPISYSVDHHQ
jgi:hypothetical protein